MEKFNNQMTIIWLYETDNNKLAPVHDGMNKFLQTTNGRLGINWDFLWENYIIRSYLTDGMSGNRCVYQINKDTKKLRVLVEIVYNNVNQLQQILKDEKEILRIHKGYLCKMFPFYC